MLPETPELSEAKRALLEKYLRGDLSPATKSVGIVTQQVQKSPGPPLETDSRAPLVAVQTGGSKRPFFFLHGDYKHGAAYCFPLARDLGADQPFYALDPYSFDGQEIPSPTEVMAAAHIKTMRSVQPKGPYFLGGFCNGGTVVYEMARQLSAAGERVDLLVVIDPPLIGHLKPIYDVVKFLCNFLRLGREKQVYWFLWTQHVYRYLLHLSRCLRYPHYRRLKDELDQPIGANTFALRLKDLFEYKVSQGTERQVNSKQIERGPTMRGSLRSCFSMVFPDPIFPPVEVLHPDYPNVFYWATAQYRPGHYPGKSTFFFFQDSEGHPRRAKWRTLAESIDKAVEMQVVTGTHITCKNEHLHDLAESLRASLSKASESS